MEKIDEVARRRGFFWMSSEIYGGMSGFYDYAHLGTALKRKWEAEWRNFFLSDDNFYEIEPANIMHEKVFQASGHVESFVDPVVKCGKCGNIERADELMENILGEKFEGMSPEELSGVIKKHNVKCLVCGGKFEDVGVLNLMFPLAVGSANAYLRGETAQGAYVNFAREFETLRKKLPMGLGIIGKAYRNEISPRNLLIRMREFTQAELQIFFDPDKMEEHPDFKSVEDYNIAACFTKKKTQDISCRDLAKHLPAFYVYYMARVQKFFLEIMKIPKELFRFRQLSDEEKAFYNKYHWDVEVQLGDLGFKEVGGVHYRTDHDLSGHQKTSGKDMSVFVDGKKFLPHVLELSFGVDRNLYALLEMFYREEKERKLFTFPRNLGPFDCAVFPLVNKDGLDAKAKELKEFLKESGFSVFYDASGSIGRRYRRTDEIGVAACITVDHKTLEDQTVTVRDRDSMKQARVGIQEADTVLRRFINGQSLETLGDLV